jgi:hypothetical protein
MVIILNAKMLRFEHISRNRKKTQG